MKKAMRREKDFFDDPETEDRSIRNLWQAIDTGDRAPGRRSMLTVLTLCATIAVLFAVLWYSYPRDVELQDQTSAPVLEADATPARIPPDDPGGMDIPHRNSAVFDAMSSDDREGKPAVENLLAAEEEPMPKARLFAGLNTQSVDSTSASDPAVQEEKPREISESIPFKDKTSEDAEAISENQASVARKFPASSGVIPEGAVMRETSAPKEAEAEAKPEPVVTAQKQEKPPVEKPSTTANSVASLKTKESPSRPPSPAQAEKAAKTEPAAGSALGSATKGTHYIQLSSLQERSRANAEWASLKKKFPSQLGALDMRVQEADLGSKGTYYRIQAGPLSKSRAESLCSAIKKQKPGACLIVKR